MTDTQTRIRTLPSDQNASGRTFGQEEIELLRGALDSGVLTSTKGTFVRRLEAEFAELLGVRHAFACSSGTAAVHCAVAALDPEPGDEIISTPITDMGALTPILYQGAIPVFADVDPRTFNITAESIAARLSERTRAIVVTHLFGNPCQMDEIMQLADEHGLPVIEDCAQSYLATHAGRNTGSFGAIGCFSLQQGKHITTGEGGMVTTDDDQLARRIFLFINKAWGYGDAHPDHTFLALNYRMCELAGAVACAQLGRLEQVVRRRVELAELLTARLTGVPGIDCPTVRPQNRATWWKYCLLVDEQVIEGGSPGLGRALAELGIPSAPRYIHKPAFECALFREQKTFGSSRFPFTLARAEALDHSRDRFPGSYQALERILVLPINERYSDADIDHLGDSIRDAVAGLSRGGAA